MEETNKKKFPWLIILGIIIVVIIALVFIFLKFNKNADVKDEVVKKDILIGFSITSLQEERWQKDKTEFLKKAQGMGAIVDLQVAQNNALKQISQIENMIISGVDVIVIVPYQSDGLTEVIQKAHDAGIKVISYDRLIKNSNTDLYISFDNEKVGEYQAEFVINAVKSKIDQGQKIKIAYVGGSEADNNAHLVKNGSFKVIQPLIDNKKAEIVFDQFSIDWNPDEAYKNLKGYLSKNGAKVDAVIAANDGTAFGAITALKEYKLDGKVPVSGQDAELAALQRIVSGTQTMTVYKPISKLASSAVELAIKLAEGVLIETTKTTNDGQFNVPSFLLDPIAITKDNIDDTIIKDGYQTKEDIYKQL
jgi:D-xylose transport system substrate-binding protein